jgi:TatD DNase family protein
LFIDSHAHLYLEEFDYDREQVIINAHNAGVGIIINAGIDPDSSQEAIKLAGAFPGLLATAGIHPQATSSANYQSIEKIDMLAADTSVVAIGEIGLDYYRETQSKDVQLQVFEDMLAIASVKKLPVVIHCRSAEEDTLKVLNKWSGRTRPVRGKWRGIRHCFSENLETALLYVDMGFMLSFGAYVGYPSSKNLCPVLEELPSDSFLLETDSPYLPLQKMRGKRNDSSYIPLIAETIASIRGESISDVARNTTENARLIFGLDPSITII